MITHITAKETALIATLQRTTEALTAVTAERDALRADAERYRLWVNLVCTEKGWMILCEAFTPIRGTPGKVEVDQAIDLAMKGTS